MLQAVDNLPPASAQRSAGSPVDGLILAGSASAKTPARTPGQGTPSRILAAAQGAQDFAQQPQPQQANDAAEPAVPEILSKAFRSNSLELSCLTMSAAQMELQHLPVSLQEQLQTVLQDVADRFSALLRSRLRPTAIEVQQESNTPPKQLATSKFYKLLLRQDLQKLQEQKAEWAELLAKYSEAPALVPAPAEEQEGQQQEVAKPLDVTQMGQDVHTKIAVQVGSSLCCLGAVFVHVGVHQHERLILRVHLRADHSVPSQLDRIFPAASCPCNGFSSRGSFTIDQEAARVLSHAARCLSIALPMGACDHSQCDLRTCSAPVPLQVAGVEALASKVAQLISSAEQAGRVLQVGRSGQGIRRLAVVHHRQAWPGLACSGMHACTCNCTRHACMPCPHRPGSARHMLAAS